MGRRGHNLRGERKEKGNKSNRIRGIERWSVTFRRGKGEWGKMGDRQNYRKKRIVGSRVDRGNFSGMYLA